MKEYNLLLLPGDGIGIEIMDSVETMLAWYEQQGIAKFNTQKELIGGACYDQHGVSITDQTVDKASQVDAILFGAVGGEKWANVPFEQRPEAGLLHLRKDFQLFANIRPAYCFDSLTESSSLKPEYLKGLDLIILRELCGGVYFGEPKEIKIQEDGQERATDGQIYHTFEIERIARVAFELARTRKNKVTSVEKHNVMMTGLLWKKIVTRIHNEEYRDVELVHMLADNCAMQLIRNPKQFDVIVTDNLFGDILSDEAAMLTGSLGMLPSASLGAPNAEGKRKALYEPVHGSAPDIAGKDIANPIAMINSLALAFKYSLNLEGEAKKLEKAINAVLAQNIRTKDIADDHSKIVGTKEMTMLILKQMENQ